MFPSGAKRPVQGSTSTGWWRRDDKEMLKLLCIQNIRGKKRKKTADLKRIKHDAAPLTELQEQ